MRAAGEFTLLVFQNSSELLVISRRQLIVGAGLGSAGLAGLSLSRHGGQSPSIPDLDALVPASLGRWTRVPSDQVVLPPDDLLTASIYDQVVVRGYRDGPNSTVYLVIAYGAAQSYSMQLHRPEFCYPAAGYSIASFGAAPLTVGRKYLPAAFLRAVKGGREEAILYWTRIGDAFPQSVWQQRLAIAGAAFRGDLTDGVLVRLSRVSQYTGGELEMLAQFSEALFQALPPSARAVLFGRRLMVPAEV